MQLNYDASGYTPKSFDPLPSGWYNIALSEGLETPVNNKPDSTYYKAVFEVLDGQFKGRKLFHNFNFKNDNPKAVEIAYEQLGTICHATGIMKPPSMDVFIGKPLQGKVKLKPPVLEEDGVTEKYEAGNEIKGFRPYEAAGASAPGAAATGSGGLPEGFTAGVEVKPEASAPAAATAPAAAAIPSAAAATAPAEPQKRLVMTAKAGGATFEQFKAHDANWTEQMLVDQEYAVWEVVEPAKPTIPAAAAIPSTPAATAPVTAAATDAPAAESDDETPPWLQGQQ